MVDIHSHVLWGVDDGSPTIEVSLEMLRMASEAGTTDIVATPHSNGEFLYQPELIDEQIRELNERTGRTDPIAPARRTVYTGCSE
jgi:protein-tyrosine phosphatase